MSLTLNIIEHELKLFGRVVRTCEGNPSFQSARLYLEGRAFAPGVLYVCQTPDEVAEVLALGCYAVYAAAEAREASGADGAGALDASPDDGTGGFSAFANDGRDGTVAASAGAVGPDNASEEPAALAADPGSAGATLTVHGIASALDVFDALLEMFSRFETWTAAMDRICQTGGSIQQLVDLSEPFLKNNVVVLDPALKLLGYTKGVPCDDPITIELIAHGYHTEENIRKFKLHKRFKSWAESRGFVVNDTHEICKYVTVVRSFASRSSFSLIVVMMCNMADPEPALLDVYEMFAERIGFYAMRDYPGNKPSGNVVDTFLKDLISGQVRGEEAVRERGGYAGLPVEARFTLYYITADADSIPGHRLLSDVSRVVAPAKTISIDDAVVVLNFSALGEQPQLRHALLENGAGEAIDERLEKMISHYDLSCGKSSAFFKLAQAPIAFEQARQALSLGRRRLKGSDEEDAGCIFTFDDYSADYLTSTLEHGQMDVLSLTRAGSLLSAISRADAQSNTDNYEFLYAYLLHERRTSTVAGKLHMHRNNVNYRIRRIEEQFDLNTDDPKLRVELLMAYKLREALIGHFAQ